MNEFLKTIDTFQYESFRNRVRKECNISRTAWCKWRNGEQISDKYKEIINNIAMDMFSRKVFN